MSQGKKLTQEEFVQRSNTIHNSKYDYSKCEYINSQLKVEIICPIHGSFFQRAFSHILGSQNGCPLCSNIKVGAKNSVRGKQLFGKSQEWFIEKASALHSNVFDYSQSQYKNYYTKLIIICKKHGPFLITPDTHLHGTGCRACSKTRKFSNKAISWLSSIERDQNIFIQHAANIGEYSIPTTNFNVDGFHKETNTVYEFYGDKWHGNLDRFKPEDKCHPFDKNISAGELNTKTKTREIQIRALGYNIITKWET